MEDQKTVRTQELGGANGRSRFGSQVLQTGKRKRGSKVTDRVTDGKRNKWDRRRRGARFVADVA